MMIEERGPSSRSCLIAELIRDALAEHEELSRQDQMLTGTITLIYHGDRGRAREQIVQTQASYAHEIISSQHVFLEEDQSLEAMLAQGTVFRLKTLCDALRHVRGVQQLYMVTTNFLPPPLHSRCTVAHTPAEQLPYGSLKLR
jgi:CopG family nickel-responsive transcriptional regulator